MENKKATIICPHCKQEVSLDDALIHGIKNSLEQEYKNKREQDRSEIIKTAQEKAEKNVSEKFELTIKTTLDDLKEEKLRNQKLLEQLTEMNKLIRDLKRKDEERDFEVQKKLAQSEEKIRHDAQKIAEEQQRLKILEKDKQLQNAVKEADELRRKLQQGSQQNQGEVLELELEKILKNEFPNDKISPVAKGIRGADLVQEVWDRNGVRCGTILWETKNAKWNEEWINKLKSDQRQINAELAIIISEQLPQGIKGAAYRNGVWIAHRAFCVGIAMALRLNLVQTAFIRRSTQGKNEKKEILWNYLSSVEFTQRIESIFETFDRMRLQLEKEKRTITHGWAQREKELQLLNENTSYIHGGLKGLMGSALPEIKSLELEDAKIGVELTLDYK